MNVYVHKLIFEYIKLNILFTVNIYVNVTLIVHRLILEDIKLIILIVCYKY